MHHARERAQRERAAAEPEQEQVIVRVVFAGEPAVQLGQRLVDAVAEGELRKMSPPVCEGDSPVARGAVPTPR